MTIRFVEFDKQYFEKSKKWLSDPQIKWLTLTPEIDEEARERWFWGLKERKDYLIWGLEVDYLPVGAVGIKHIDYNQCSGEYWGYIGEKQLIGHGIGKAMLKEMIDQALALGLKKLVLRVGDYNERARSLYKYFGFQETSREQQQGFQIIFMEKMLT